MKKKGNFEDNFSVDLFPNTDIRCILILFGVRLKCLPFGSPLLAFDRYAHKTPGKKRVRQDTLMSAR